MQQRHLGPFSVSAIGLGCMNICHAYGAPASEAEAERLLLAALDAGVTHFDTAALYGFGVSETLVGKFLYADYVSGKLWALDYDHEAGQVRANYSIPTDNKLPVISFGEDEAGEVYFMIVTPSGQGGFQFAPGA